MGSWFSWFSWFKPKPKPKPPKPVKVKATLAVWALDAQTHNPIPDAPVDIVSGDFTAPEDARTDAGGYAAFQVVVGETHIVEVHADGYASLVKEIPFNGNQDVEFLLEPISAPVPGPTPGGIRTGTVRLEGRSFADDGGRFYPLGGTLFWALYGWKNERDRLKQNWRFLQQHDFDFQRVLGDVGWSGEEIDSTWPDYEQLLGEMIDSAYDECGLRTAFTLWGGSSRDPLAAADRARRVLDARPNKVIYVEPANESQQNGPSDSILDQMVNRLKGNWPVAASTPMGGMDWNAWLDARVSAGATISTVHLDRTEGDDDWRFVRQSWDFRGRHEAMSNNEPKGPRSSVSQTTSVPRLTMARAVGILTGVEAYVLHNGAGVTGRVDPAHDRPANLWEVPGIDDVMTSLRNLDLLLPQGLGIWMKTTQHGGWAYPGFENLSQPLSADAIWSDGYDHGCSRCYGAVNGSDFVTMVYGVKGYVDLRAERDMRIKAYDCVTHAVVADVLLMQGLGVRLPGGSGTDASYIIRGTNA